MHNLIKWKIKKNQLINEISEYRNIEKKICVFSNFFKTFGRWTIFRKLEFFDKMKICIYRNYKPDIATRGQQKYLRWI